jgi:hypothetical protein
MHFTLRKNLSDFGRINLSRKYHHLKTLLVLQIKRLLYNINGKELWQDVDAPMRLIKQNKPMLSEDNAVVNFSPIVVLQ